MKFPASSSSVEHMTAQRVDQFTERERKRIASDLHDDLGAKLLTIVHTADATRVPQLAREALEEMRLSVRGLAGRPVRLDDALADWRAEIIGRLTQAKIETLWDHPVDLTMLPARLFSAADAGARGGEQRHQAQRGLPCEVRCTIEDRSRSSPSGTTARESPPTCTAARECRA
jgi:hypothetical protein